MQIQTYKTSYEDPVFTLGERSDIANTMKAPYTVFAKKHNDHNYSFIIYSLGRPQNVVWGYVTIDKESKVASKSGSKVSSKVGSRVTYTVEYGCRYKSVKVINDMSAIKKKDGYHLIATLARDRATPTLLGQLMMEAYLGGNDFRLHAAMFGQKYKRYGMTYREMDLALLDICDEYGLNYAPDKCEISKAMEILIEKEFLLDPNLGTRYRSPDPNAAIPDTVVDAILDFIAHTPRLNEQMVASCYTIEECKRSKLSNTKECGLYHPLPEDQLQ